MGVKVCVCVCVVQPWKYFKGKMLNQAQEFHAAYENIK